jgi:hypothetical protein
MILPKRSIVVGLYRIGHLAESRWIPDRGYQLHTQYILFWDITMIRHLARRKSKSHGNDGLQFYLKKKIWIMGLVFHDTEIST